MSKHLLELEQTELCTRWGKSLATVRRIVRVAKKYDQSGKFDPITYRGLRPVFTTQQADAMLELHDAMKRATLASMARPVRRKRAQNILTVAQAKRRAAR